MAKERVDRAALEMPLRFAKAIIEVVEILDRRIAIQSGIDALEQRKQALQTDVAALLQKHETAKQSHESQKGSLADEIILLAQQRDDERKSLTEERAERAKQADDDARAYRARNDKLAGELREEVERLKAEVVALRAQKQGLENELQSTLTKYSRVR